MKLTINYVNKTNQVGGSAEQIKRANECLERIKTLWQAVDNNDDPREQELKKYEEELEDIKSLKCFEANIAQTTRVIDLAKSKQEFNKLILNVEKKLDDINKENVLNENIRKEAIVKAKKEINDAKKEINDNKPAMIDFLKICVKKMEKLYDSYSKIKNEEEDNDALKIKMKEEFDKINKTKITKDIAKISCFQNDEFYTGLQSDDESNNELVEVGKQYNELYKKFDSIFKVEEADPVQDTSTFITKLKNIEPGTVAKYIAGTVAKYIAGGLILSTVLGGVYMTLSTKKTIENNKLFSKQNDKKNLRYKNFYL